MPDLLFVLLTVGFFVVAAGAVAACDRIIGPDDSAGPGADEEADRTAEPVGSAS